MQIRAAVVVRIHVESGKFSDLRAACLRRHIDSRGNRLIDRLARICALFVIPSKNGCAELIAAGILPCRNVGFQIVADRFKPPDGLRQFHQLPLSLLHFLDVRRCKSFQPVDFLRDLILFQNQWVVRRNRRDFRCAGGEVTVAVCGSSVVIARNDLMDECALALQVVPLTAVKGLLRDVGVDRHLRVRVSLADNSPPVLFNVAGAVWRV